MHASDRFDLPTNVAFSNLFADINGLGWGQSNRGPNSRSRIFEVGNGILGAHTSEYNPGTFTTLHRHGPGAHVLWLTGRGYSLLFPDGGEKVKEDWGPGTLIVPPSWWWHQHAVVSREPAQYIALKLGSQRYKMNRQSGGAMLSTRKGGNLMHIEDFPPGLYEELNRIFVAECAKYGTTPHMEPVPDR
jgi:hypothetical protein